MAYKAQQFIKAIPGTGGVITALAKAVGCDWHTAKKYIEDHATVKQAWENERNAVTDRARYNVVNSIIQDKDLQTSKWWLATVDPEFMPKSKQEINANVEGAGFMVILDEPEAD